MTDHTRAGPDPAEAASDEELLGRASTDPAAFAEFYRRHVAAVRTVAIRRLDDPAEVADVIAVAFLRLIESADRFNPRRGRALPWLYAIAANAAADERRRRRREREAVARLSGRTYWSQDDLLRIEEQIDATAATRHLVAAMAELPDSERRLLELVGVDELTVQDAAAALGIREGTARMRLSRSRRRLRHHLDRATPSPGSPPPRSANPLGAGPRTITRTETPL